MASLNKWIIESFIRLIHSNQLIHLEKQVTTWKGQWITDSLDSFRWFTQTNWFIHEEKHWIIDSPDLFKTERKNNYFVWNDGLAETLAKTGNIASKNCILLCLLHVKSILLIRLLYKNQFHICSRADIRYRSTLALVVLLNYVM